MPGSSSRWSQRVDWRSHTIAVAVFLGGPAAAACFAAGRTDVGSAVLAAEAVIIAVAAISLMAGNRRSRAEQVQRPIRPPSTDPTVKEIMPKTTKYRWSYAVLGKDTWYACLAMLVFTAASVLYSQLAKHPGIDSQGAEVAGCAAHAFGWMGLAAAAVSIFLSALRLTRR